MPTHVNFCKNKVQASLNLIYFRIFVFKTEKPIKCKFQVKVFKTYFDDEIEVKVELSDDEESQIKKLVADH